MAAAKCYQCIPKPVMQSAMISLLCQWANNLTPPVPAAPYFYWYPETSDPTWDDTNGTFQGDFAFFMANADLPTVTNLDFTVVTVPVQIDTLRVHSDTLLYCQFNNNVVSNFLLVAPALLILSCNDNQIASLDTSGYPALQTLNCGANPITSLDVSSNTQLLRLDCTGLNLSVGGLHLSTCTLLQDLVCPACLLNGAGLNITGCAQLAAIDCSGNLLTSIDVSTNPLIGSPVTAFFDNNSLTQAAVDAILAQLVANGLLNGAVWLNLGTNAHPSAAGMADRAILIASGWTVLINP